MNQQSLLRCGCIAVFLMMIPCPFIRSQIIHQTNRYGPFEVGISKSHSIVAEIVTSYFPDTRCYVHRSDVALILEDDRSGVIYQERFHDSCDEENKYEVESIPVPTKGVLLLVMSETVPSAPGSGVGGQYFCYNDSDRFVPVTGGIYPSTNSLGVGQFPLISKNVGGMDRVFVEVGIRTGYFTVVWHYPLHLEGTQEKEARRMEFPTYPVRIDPAEAKRNRGTPFNTPTITLYPNPHRDSATAKKVAVTKDSKIDFIDACEEATPGGELWLHIRVGGEEGYIAGWIDLSTVGLPPAG